MPDKPNRLRVSPRGKIQIPEELREQLGWSTGDYLEFEVGDDRLTLWRVEVDFFEEAARGPDESAFDKAFKKQAEDKKRAFDLFDKKMREGPGELRPEDRPDFWD